MLVMDVAGWCVVARACGGCLLCECAVCGLCEVEG